MKKKLLLTILTLLCFSTTLLATRLNIKGDFRSRAVYLLNKDLDKNTNNELSVFDTRFRFWLIPTISKQLRVVYAMQIGDISWGDTETLFQKDPNNNMESGGSQGTLGVNVQTKELFLEYKGGSSTIFKIGFFRFTTPCQFVLDADIPGIQFSWKTGSVTVNLLYSRAYSGPGWKGTGDPDNQSYAYKGLDDINLGDDRNDYYLSIGIDFGKAFKMNGWLLFDDNNRFKEQGPTTKLLTSDLYYFGLQAKGTLSQHFLYEANAVLNMGTINSIGEGEESVFAYTIQGRIQLKTSLFTLKSQFRLLSGNSYADTAPGKMIQQFNVIDGDEGSSGSWMGLLFGSGPFSHQSYFYYGSASARRVNITKGYFVRDDPGITAIEVCLEKGLHEGKALFYLSFGYAMTTRAVQTASGEEAYSLGTEMDIGIKIFATKELTFHFQFAYLFPGEALAPTLKLDDSIYDRPDFGTDPAFKADASVSVHF